jgi:hypothetical protein
MKKPLKLAFASSLLALATLAPALAEPLKKLATKTHYHGITFARSGSAVLLLASHHGLFAVDKDGQATQVSPMQDYMGFSPNPADPLTIMPAVIPQVGAIPAFSNPPMAERPGSNFRRVWAGRLTFIRWMSAPLIPKLSTAVMANCRSAGMVAKAGQLREHRPPA